MLAYDASFKQLPLDPHTVLRGMASVDGHPDRTHSHISYRIRNTDELVKITNDMVTKNCKSRKNTSTINLNDMGIFNDIVLPSDYTPPRAVDQNCPYSLLNAIPMASDGANRNFMSGFLSCAPSVDQA